MEPWLSIIGIGEDGLDGLSEASRHALEAAETIFGGERHLELAHAGPRGQAWSVPFSIEPVLALKGRKVVVLASGDPFWFGVGGTLAEQLEAREWQAFPSLSTFALVAARLGWRIEDTICLGLHAASFAQLRPHLGSGRQVICLVRDGTAVGALGAYLNAQGFGASDVFVCEAMGGPREKIHQSTAGALSEIEVHAPVAVALRLAGGAGLVRASGLPDAMFDNDGQITKRPVRALTLSALAPRAGECLWDIGAGSGSISIEWLLATGRGGHAIAIEPNADRAKTARANAAAFGFENQFTLVEGKAPEALAGLPRPNAVFVGGGASDAVLAAIFAAVPPATRVVVNSVTLETEALLIAWSERHGGDLMRIELSHSQPLGGRRGWSSSRPIAQWSVTT